MQFFKGALPRRAHKLPLESGLVLPNAQGGRLHTAVDGLLRLSREEVILMRYKCSEQSDAPAFSLAEVTKILRQLDRQAKEPLVRVALALIVRT